jgi:Mg-chelatase subunit ChlI
MQEGDVQIKGYPVRLPLDVLLCFTANPEDYTRAARSSRRSRTASGARS